MPSTHSIPELCPRCEVNTLTHVHCESLRCSYKLVVCTECDAAQAVARVIADHEKDCAHADVHSQRHAKAA